MVYNSVIYMFKLMWSITGTGYLLQESIDLMKELQELQF